MSQNSIFNTGALVDVGKSNLFDLSKENLFTADIGKLYPVYCQFLTPSDKINVSVASIIKSLPTLAPFYGRLDAEIHAFVVPLRLLWRYFPKWVYYPNETEHMPPSITIDKLAGYSSKPLADYLNVTKFGLHHDFQQVDLRVNVFKPLAYHLIWNEYFRNEKLQPDLTDETEQTEDAWLNDSDLEDYNGVMSDAFWDLHYVNWRRDYFTSCLPNAIAGIEPTLQLFGQGATAPVNVNLASLLDAPATTMYDYQVPQTDDLDAADYIDPQGTMPPFETTKGWKTLLGLGFDPSAHTTGNLDAILVSSGADQGLKFSHNSLDPDFDPDQYALNFNYANTLFSAGHQGQVLNTRANLMAQLSDVNSEVTANSLRTLFAVEKWLEINNITGNRYIEGTLAYYGVRVPDMRAQRPEYLGRTSFNIQTNEVVQQSESNRSKQGTRTGLLNSVGASRNFKYYAFEHSILMFTFSIRPQAFYYQGIAKDWFIMDQFDFPYRLFQHLGEQEVKDYELYVPSNAPDGFFDQTFGYQSRYAEWRSAFNEVHGDFRSSLDFWQMGRKFYDSDIPALSDQFVTCRNDSGDFNRVFASEDPKFGHFMVDLYFKVRAVRRLAYHSKPFLLS